MEVSEKYGINTTTDNKSVVKKAEIVVLAVEPQTIVNVLVGVRSSGRVASATGQISTRQ